MMPQEPLLPPNASIIPTPSGIEWVEQTVAQSRPTGYEPVLEETFTVEKQVRETGQVRLIKTVHQEQQTLQIPLIANQIIVERVPINELVDGPTATRQEGDTVIYPVLKEEYVLLKRIRLVEEIRVTRRHIQTIDKQTVSIHREEISVERTAVDNSGERSDSIHESTRGESPSALDTPAESSL